MKAGEVVYLGDGAYLRFDGDRFALLANDHLNPSDIVWLEPCVAKQLVQKIEETFEEHSN